MPDNIDTLEQIYTEIAAAHDRLSDALAGLDAKAVLVVGYAMAAATFLATQRPQTVLAILAYVFLGLSIVSAIFAYAVRDYQEVEPRAIFSGYYEKEKLQFLRELGATRAKHYEYNKNMLNIKAKYWWGSLALLIAGAVLMVASLVVHTDNHDKPERAAKPVSAIQQSSKSNYSASRATKLAG